MRSGLNGLLVFGALVALGGCAAIGGTQAVNNTYELRAPTVSAASSVRRGTQILIVEPTALKALDSENIVVGTDALTIQYLDESQWSDRLPRLVQQRLAQAFDNSGRFSGVGLPGQGLAIDYQVITEIRTFGVDLNGQRARVVLQVKLLNDRNGVVISANTFEAEAGVSASATPDQFVAALNAAFEAVAEDIVIWVTARI